MVGRFHQYLELSYGDFELRSRRFHFDLVYLENLERRIKCNLINPFRERRRYWTCSLNVINWMIDLEVDVLEMYFYICLLYWDQNVVQAGSRIST